MGKCLEGPDDPIVTELEHQELLALLLAHALALPSPLLLEALHRCSPSGTPPWSLLPPLIRHPLLLISYTSQVTGSGRPLPDILSYKFLHTLHEAVLGFLRNHPVTVEKIHREDLIKLVAAIRSIVLKAVFLEKKFTAKDFEILLTTYMPQLPVNAKNKVHWEDWLSSLHLPPLPKEGEEAHPNLVTALNTIHHSAKRVSFYFRAQLKLLAKERQSHLERPEAHTDWVLSIWHTVSPKLSHLSKVAAFLVPPTHPGPKLRSHPSPKARLLGQKLGKGPEGEEVGEEGLLEFLDYLADLRVKNAFWDSQFVKNHLANSNQPL